MLPWKPFGSQPFWCVWAGEAASMLGDAAFTVVFAWLVLSHSGSPATLAAVMLVTAVPRGVLLLVGGAVTDRFSPRTIMLLSHLVRGAAMAVLAGVVHAGVLEVWHFYALGLVVGAAEAFFLPASGSILPTLVEHRDLPRANAVGGMSEQASRLAGPLLGGLLVAGPGAALALAFNAATFFVAAAAVLAAPRWVAAGERGGLSLSATLGEIRSGLSYIRRDPAARVVLLLIAAATLSYSGLFAVGLPALALAFDEGAVVLGVMLSAWGLGQLIGAAGATVTGLPRRWGWLIVGTTLVEGASFAVLGFVPHPALAAALLVVLGLGVAYSTDVALPTFIQLRTPREMLGRVDSVMNLPRFALEPVSIAMMGILVAVDVRWAFAAAAVPMLLAGCGLAASGAARGLGTEPAPRPAA